MSNYPWCVFNGRLLYKCNGKKYVLYKTYKKYKSSRIALKHRLIWGEKSLKILGCCGLLFCVVIVAAVFCFYLPSVFWLGNSHLNLKEESHSAGEKNRSGVYKAELCYRYFTWLNTAASPSRSVTVSQEHLWSTMEMSCPRFITQNVCVVFLLQLKPVCFPKMNCCTSQNMLSVYLE